MDSQITGATCLLVVKKAPFAGVRRFVDPISFAGGLEGSV